MTKTEKVSKGLLMTALICGTVVMGANPAGAASPAEESLNAFTLDPMVVTAQRQEKTDLNTPASITVITSKDIKRTGAVTVYDAIEHTIGLNSSSYGPAGRDYGMSSGRLTVRGLDKGTLVLVNGSPVNLLNYNGTGGIPAEMVEKIEVVRGTSSVLYGAEALAGAVNIITKKPSDIKESYLGGKIGNYDSEWSAGTGFGVGAIFVKRQYIGAVDRTSRRGNYFNKSNKAMKPNGLDNSSNNSLYLTTQLGKDLTFNWSYSDMNMNRPQYNPNGMRYRLYKYDDIRNNLNLIYDNKDSNFKSVLSYNKRRAYGDGYEYGSNTTWASERYNMYGINLDNQKMWRLRQDKDTFIAGLTLAREHFYDPSTEHKTPRKNALRNSVSLYGSYTYAFSPALCATLGLRGQAISDYAVSESVFLPQLQTSYKINDKASWYVNLGKAFQMPPLNQYFSKKGTDFNHLNPQQGWTYETGVKFINDKSSWKLNVFHMDIRDQFKWLKNDDNTDYMSNAGDFRNTGIEVEFAQAINDSWTYNLGFSYSNPEANDTGSWEQVNSRVQALAGVNYAKKKFNGNINFLYLGDREVSGYAIDGVFDNVPDRIQLNANFRYVPDEHNLITLSLYNLLNRDNSVNKWENLDLPFNWLLGYQYKF